MSAAAATVTVECRGCKSAKKRSQRLQIWITCEKCGEQYMVAPGVNLKDPEAGRHPITLNRATAIVGTDMSLLAKWTRRVYGGAASLEPVIRGDSHGRQEDERVQEFHRAMDVHRFFERFKQVQPTGYAVIWRVYLEKGGDASGIGDLYGEVGKQFASKDKRAVWERKQKGDKSPAVRAEGKRLHDKAVMDYAALRLQSE